MPLDINYIKNSIKENLKNQMSVAYSKPMDDYDQFAEFISEAIGEALKYIKDNADVTGVTTGADTITGGID